MTPQIESARVRLTTTFCNAIRAGDGWLGEDDQTINDASQELIAAYVERSGSCWLGLINPYTDDQKEQPIWRFDGGDSLPCTCAAFVLPNYDQALNYLIKERIATPYEGTEADSILVAQIFDRIDEVGGSSLHWT